MFCRKCGKSIPDDSVFCPYCGETVVLEEPAAEETDTASYGRCEHCGKPLQADDGTLCAECAAKMIEQYASEEKPKPNEHYPYGACGLCGEPLEADDELICKKCKTAQNERDRAIKASSKERAETKKHGSAGGIAAIVVLAFCAIGMIVYISQNSGSQPVQTSAYASSSTEPQENNAVVSDDISSSSAAPSSAEPTEKPNLELLSDNCTVDQYSTRVTGKVKNNTLKQFTYVQIQYALYDASGNQIGTALANVNGLESGGTWKFDAIGLYSETDKYKLIELIGY